MRMTRRRALTLGLAATLFGAADARAQAQIQQTTDAVSVGAAFGGIANLMAHPGSQEVTVLIERPVVTTWHVRAEVGRGRFVFPAPEGIPGQSVSLTRFTFSVIRTTPEWDSGPVVVYAGGGMGAYRFGADPGFSRDFTRFGVNAVAGALAPRDTPFSIAVQVQGHFIRGPRAGAGVFDIIGAFSIGARLRF